MIKHEKIADLLQNTKLYPIARQLYNSFEKMRLLAYRPQLGQILNFSQVPITPYQYLLDHSKGLPIHQGGALWPEWDAQVGARHCRRGKPVDDLPIYTANIQNHIKEPAVWCGAIVNHFGHQIADFSTRILHARTTHPHAKFLFAGKVKAQYRTLADTPTMFQAILDWYDIQPHNVEIIHQPTIAHELFVAPQAEQLGGPGPSTAYLDMLDAHVERRLPHQPRQKAVFVSRAGVGVHFAGEAYLEQLMRTVGIQVIRPETMPLADQLAAYAASEQLIFTEGSALHSLQLLGRSINYIHVLNRRPYTRLAENVLNMRAKSLSYIEVSRGVVYGLTPSGHAETAKGIPILQEEAIVDYLRSLDPTFAKRWKSSMYRESRDQDVMLWLKWEAQRDNGKLPNTKAAIIRNLSKLGLAHLVPMAEECLLPS